MKILRCCAIVILLGLSSTAALADSVPPDPTAKLGGGGGSAIVLTPSDTTFSGTFTQPTGGGVTLAFFDFRNATGFTAGAVNLDVTDTVPLSFSTDNTGDPYFNTSSPTTPTPLLPGGDLTLSWFGTDATHTGIPSATCSSHSFSSCTSVPSGSDFEFIFTVGDVLPGGSFSFQGTLVPMPEPPAVLLVLVGAVLFPFFKRS